MVVFAAVVLLVDVHTATCVWFYPGLMAQQKQLVMALPVVVDALASGFFIMFRSTRHGIRYPPMKPVATTLASQ